MAWVVSPRNPPANHHLRRGYIHFAFIMYIYLTLRWARVGVCKKKKNPRQVPFKMANKYVPREIPEELCIWFSAILIFIDMEIRDFKEGISIQPWPHNFNKCTDKS